MKTLILALLVTSAPAFAADCQSAAIAAGKNAVAPDAVVNSMMNSPNVGVYVIRFTAESRVTPSNGSGLVDVTIWVNKNTCAVTQMQSAVYDDRG